MHQPFHGHRQPGASLTAMLQGRPGYLPNPQQSVRDVQRRIARPGVQRPGVQRAPQAGQGLGAYLVARYFQT